ARNTRPFNRGMADPVLESKSFSFIRQRMTMLAPDRGDAGNLLILLAGSCKSRLQSLRIRSERSEYDVDVSGPEGLLPMLGATLIGVAQHSGASSHALLKFR